MKVDEERLGEFVAELSAGDECAGEETGLVVEGGHGFVLEACALVGAWDVLGELPGGREEEELICVVFQCLSASEVLMALSGELAIVSACAASSRLLAGNSFLEDDCASDRSRPRRSRRLDQPCARGGVRRPRPTPLPMSVSVSNGDSAGEALSAAIDLLVKS